MLNYLFVYYPSFQSQSNPVGNVSLNPHAHEQSKAATEMFDSHLDTKVQVLSIAQSQAISDIMNSHTLIEIRSYYMSLNSTKLQLSSLFAVTCECL